MFLNLTRFDTSKHSTHAEISPKQLLDSEMTPAIGYKERGINDVVKSRTERMKKSAASAAAACSTPKTA